MQSHSKAQTEHLTKQFMNTVATQQRSANANKKQQVPLSKTLKESGKPKEEKKDTHLPLICSNEAWLHSQTGTPILKYQILPGNNSNIVRQVMLATRAHLWFETPAAVDTGN
jgi:hypothetical protein